MSEIYSRGMQYAESRVVIEKHFPIDIIGSRVGHLLYLSRALEQKPFTEFTQLSAIEAREYLKKSLVDTGLCQDSLRQCLGVLPIPVYDDYANNDFKIGYLGQLENHPATPVTAKDLPEILANLLLARFPYLSKEQRLAVLASTAFPNNRVTSMDDAVKAIDPSVKDVTKLNIKLERCK